METRPEAGGQLGSCWYCQREGSQGMVVRRQAVGRGARGSGTD